MKRKITLVTVLAMTLAFQSCGVMFGGSRYNATIVAKDHPQADIYVNGAKIGTGSATASFPRNKELTVELREEGCENTTQHFDKMFRTGNFILSVVSWGLIGIGVDLGTGAAYKPDHVHNTAVTKESTKNFTFNITPNCK